MSLLSAAVLCATLIGQASAPSAPTSDEPRARIESSVSVYRDANRTFEILQPAFTKRDAQRRWAELRDVRSKRTWPVMIDAHAIVQVAANQQPEDLFASLGLRAVEALMPSAGLWRVVDASGLHDGAQLADALRPAVAKGLLRQATPDLHVERRLNDINIPPNDPSYGGQWYLERMNIEAAWALSDGDRNTVVVVVDNGCDYGHPDLIDNLGTGLDVIDDDDDASHAPGVAGNEHGTSCAGIIAARGDNGTGIVGVCPECQVRCVRLLGELTPVSADVRALRFALDVNAAVVSNSWSYVNGLPAPGPVAEAIAEIQRDGRQGLGTLVAFAAGNENRVIADGEVAALPGVITVGAVTNFDEATAFTNRGEVLDFSAPAATFTTDISGPDGADPGDYNPTFGGTSAACPVAAGVAGLLASADPTASAAEIREAMVNTLRPAPFAQPGPDGHDPQYGFGIIAPEAALRRLLDLPVDSVDAGMSGGPDAGTTDAAADDESTPGSGCRTSRRPLGDTSLPWGGLAAVLLWTLRHVAVQRSRRLAVDERPLNSEVP